MSGPGRVPGLVCTAKVTSSMPASPARAGSVSMATLKVARSSFSAGSSALTAFSSALAADFRRPLSAVAALS